MLFSRTLFRCHGTLLRTPVPKGPVFGSPQKEFDQLAVIVSVQERLREAGMTPGGDGLFHDPFADHESQEDEVEAGHKEKIEFSYASYMKELNKEEILNNTDESIFSSLADLAGTGKSVMGTDYFSDLD